MSSNFRRVGFRISSLETEPDDFDGFSDPVAKPKPTPLDPARVTVGILMRRAIDVSGLPVEEVGRDGAVCVVIVPSAAWTDLARQEWKDLVRSGEPCGNGYREHWDGAPWIGWAPTEPERPGRLTEADENFAQHVAAQRHCVGFTADETWLPKDLIHVADHRIRLLAPMGADIVVVAVALCGGEVGEAFPDELAAAVTPKLLRLARRSGQTADAYLDKLRSLLAFAAATVASSSGSSPRDTPGLDHMHGMEEAVAWGLDVARDLAAYQAGTLGWAAVDRGCLVSGPPGCGKTLFARALAATCGVPLVVGSYGQWHGSGTGHQGDFLKALKQTFADARSKAPCILFIDEIDSFPDRSTLNHRYADYMIQVVNALLAEIDGSEGRDGVVLVGACNHPDKLDPALVRSGRLDRHVRIGLPDRTALAAILREHLGEPFAGADLSGAALAVSGSSGADCERLVRGARRRARSVGRDVTVADLLDEIGGVQDRLDGDLWLAAVHEAGHVVAVSTIRPGSVGMVRLGGAAGSGGLTEAMTATSGYLRADDVGELLVSLLAGRAAEHEVLGQPSSGAGGRSGSDLAKSTYIAVMASSAYGLDEAAGLVWRGTPEANALPEALAADPALAARVRERLAEAYEAARELIRPRLAAVHAIAEALVERRVLDGPEAEAIVHRHSPVQVATP